MFFDKNSISTPCQLLGSGLLSIIFDATAKTEFVNGQLFFLLLGT